VVALNFEFAPTLWESNPLVEETLDQVAVKYGPLVYCVESNDLPAGVKLTDVALALGRGPKAFTAQREKIESANVLTLTLPAFARERPKWDATQLYREASQPPQRDIGLKFVPYYAWGNRGDTEMTVWLPAR
jgi:uncharacterized protein